MAADIVSLNTEELREKFLNRYYFLPKSKFIVLSNGYDEYDFRDIIVGKIKGNSKGLLLTHAGFLYAARDPKSIFEAIEKVREKNKEMGKKIKFRQMGNIALNYDIKKLVAEKSLQDNYEYLGQLEYSKCLQNMVTSDILIIIQPDTKTQIPSKIFEYIYLNKPILMALLPKYTVVFG